MLMEFGSKTSPHSILLASSNRARLLHIHQREPPLVAETRCPRAVFCLTYTRTQPIELRRIRAQQPLTTDNQRLQTVRILLHQSLLVRVALTGFQTAQNVMADSEDIRGG
jgi:hypothetical protein